VAAIEAELVTRTDAAPRLRLCAGERRPRHPQSRPGWDTRTSSTPPVVTSSRWIGLGVFDRLKATRYRWSAPDGWGEPSSRVREMSGAPFWKRLQRRMTNERQGVVRGLRQRPVTRRMLICGNCGAEYMSSRSEAKWCSRSCQAYARVTRQKVSRTAVPPAAKPDGP